MDRRYLAATACAIALVPGAALTAEPRAKVQGDLPADLRGVIEGVIGEEDHPAENRFEARRRANTAAESSIAVLRSEGYYANTVEADVTDAAPPRAVLQIVPGPRFRMGEAGIVWEGDAPTEEVQAAATDAMDLPLKIPGRAVDVLAAEGRVLASVQKHGHADAAIQPRVVVVDHADASVRPTFRIEAGPVVHLDVLKIGSGGATRPVWVEALTPWRPGDVYDPDAVAELERRLLDTGVYDAVTVTLAPRIPDMPDAPRPVLVNLTDRKPRSIEAGASYATRDGGGVNARWTRYNYFGRADTLAVDGQIAARDSRAGVELSLPHWRRGQQTLRASASAYRLQTDAFDETGLGIAADITRRYGWRSYVTIGASADVSRTDELGAVTLMALGRDIVTVRGLGDLLLDRSDDPLGPTKGWRVSGRLEPTLIMGDTNLPYLRAVTQGTYYRRLDVGGKTVAAGRLRVGRIINGTVEQIPASQRFYAGGGGSVRGFSFQGVGPQFADGTPRGGLSLVEASLEMRRQVTSRWGGAVFVDAGAVGSSGPIDLGDSAIGAGVGVTYNLGFTPIRVDVAVPVTNRRGGSAFQIYVSIGQSF